MSINSDRPSQSQRLQDYPLLVTGQIVVEPEMPRRPATRNGGTARGIRRHSFFRLHHTSRFGLPR